MRPGKPDFGESGNDACHPPPVLTVTLRGAQPQRDRPDYLPDALVRSQGASRSPPVLQGGRYRPSRRLVSDLYSTADTSRGGNGTVRSLFSRAPFPSQSEAFSKSGITMRTITVPNVHPFPVPSARLELDSLFKTLRLWCVWGTVSANFPVGRHPRSPFPLAVLPDRPQMLHFRVTD